MAFSLKSKGTSAQDSSQSSKIYPIAALREGVVFPHTQAHLTFGRSKTNSAIESALSSDRHIIFVAQRSPVVNPTESDLYEIGTLCVIDQMLPYGNEILGLVRGLKRVKIGPIISTEPFFSATAQEIEEVKVKEDDELEALGRQIMTEFKNAFNVGKSVEFPVFMRLMSGVASAELADQVANSLDLSTEIKQELLENNNAKDRLKKILPHLIHEIKVLELEKNLSSKTHAKFEKHMKEQTLLEKKRAINEELEKLGSEQEGDDDDISLLKKRLKESLMPKDTKKKAEKELARLSQMSFNNPEANYIRSYVEWLCDMPWGKLSNNNVSLKKAETILDEEHYGLKKIKERVLEYISVMKLRSKNKDNQNSPIPTTILCFVGPPGVGKTSIGRSIAKSLGRKFIRVSLGGVRDEAEIRGHRRTYVGAMPGRIIQGIKNSGTQNPVFMLDEIDKIASDYRGDPSASLLETLDPEQNKEFSDHYLDVPFDLSKVLFITTANVLDTIPPALRDRLEIIEFSGYTSEEKQNIAQKYLWPKQVSAAGLSDKIQISNEALMEVIKRYTREAGVRDLERKLAQICRKIAKSIAEKKTEMSKIDIQDIQKFLGIPKFQETLAEKKDEIGMSTGLAWTQVGGDIMFIEVAVMPGKGDLKLTGQLGDVMKESAQAAWSYVRSKYQKLGLDKEFYKKIDVHVHVPEGAVPKDGPSAGLAIATAIISALTKKSVKRDLAMTGEITLRGRALEIGGVKEKVIAAHRAGIKTVLLPKENKKDVLEDVPANVRKDLEFHFVDSIDSVLQHALNTK